MLRCRRRLHGHFIDLWVNCASLAPATPDLWDKLVFPRQHRSATMDRDCSGIHCREFRLLSQRETGHDKATETFPFLFRTSEPSRRCLHNPCVQPCRKRWHEHSPLVRVMFETDRHSLDRLFDEGGNYSCHLNPSPEVFDIHQQAIFALQSASTIPTFFEAD